MARRSSAQHDLNTWLDSHGYHHAHARKPKTPRAVGGAPLAAAPRAPVLSYDRWAHELSEAARRHGVSISYGGETTDAWRAGKSPDEYARGMPKARHPGRGLRSRQDDGHTRVDIRWYAFPNGNKFAGGFLPMIEEDGKQRGDTWASRGYDKAEAEAQAEARAHDAASRFLGDFNVTVRKGSQTAKIGHAVKRGSSPPLPRKAHADRKALPFSTRKCYACPGEAVGVRDRRQEGGMIEAACVRHADPTIPAYPACALCQGRIRPTSASYHDVDGTFIHKACHAEDSQ